MRHRQGNLSIKKVEVEEKGTKYTTYRIDGYDLNGKRVRFSSQDRKAAQLKLLELQTSVHNADVENPLRHVQTRLTDAQIHDCELAVNLLAGRCSILDAVKKALDGNGINSLSLPKMVLSSAVVPFLAEMTERGKRHRQILQWNSSLGQFDRFSRDPFLSDITTETVAKFIGSLRTKDGLTCAAPKTRNVVRGDLHRFFSWCMEKEWLSSNPASKVPIAKIDRGLVEILTLERCRELMAHVSSKENVARYYALCLFAGLRPAEVGRIAKDPRAIDLENNVIHVSEASSKTHTSRTVVIQPNLREWLLRFPNGTAYESNGTVRAVRKRFALPQDVLRHTFISNHVAAFGSFAETAIESGNTESIIRKHYYARVSKPDAARFWDILPL